MLQDAGTAHRRGHGGWLRPAIILLSVLAVLALIGAVIYVDVDRSNYYVIAPGDAPVVSSAASCRAVGDGTFNLPGGVQCVQLVLPSGKAHPVSGSILMVDVQVGPADFGQYLFAKLPLLGHFRDGSVLVPKQEILGGAPPSQLSCQDTQQMNQATTDAPVVALRRLGYQVTEDDQGAQVDEVEPGTPAADAGVRCNDLIIGAGGRAVHTADDLIAIIHASAPGRTLSLSVRREGSSGTSTVALKARLVGTPAEGGFPAKPSQAFLGIKSETRSTFKFPFPVQIKVGAIGGPSAGLALTLGLLDALSQGRLTNGMTVAATGTINLDGSVGDVGGVAQKAVAVRRAGAKVFFVPPGELADARSQAGTMKVFPVSSLDQALADLQQMGGQVPAPPAASPTTSVPG